MTRRRRRRPGRPEAIPVKLPSRLTQVEQLEQAERDIQHRSACYYAESRERRRMPEQTRSDLAHTAALLQRRIHRMHMREELGLLKAEEARSLPSMHGEFRRILGQLGLDIGEPTNEELPEL